MVPHLKKLDIWFKSYMLKRTANFGLLVALEHSRCTKETLLTELWACPQQVCQTSVLFTIWF